jgi:hypothetical protein
MSDSPQVAKGGGANPAVDVDTAKQLASEADRPAKPTLLQQVLADREFEQQFEARLRPYLARLEENVARVSRLLQFFDTDLSKQEGGDDILRAAVVFIHAYLEDFLRTLAAELLPAGDQRSFEDIPLTGSKSFGRGERFSLGQLAQHRGKTVDQLLRQSVFDYLSRSNYNSTTEIASLLVKLGFRPEEHNKAFDAIDRMIERRHQIVHRADRRSTSEETLLQPIERAEVVDWLQATLSFTSGLLTPLMQKLPTLLDNGRPGTPS